jgi:hypothetical protein
VEQRFKGEKMINFLMAMILIFVLMLTWVYIQQVTRNYAAKHPEFGAAKEEGLACGKNCGCKAGNCISD